jgi:hypothetical protein
MRGLLVTVLKHAVYETSPNTFKSCLEDALKLSQMLQRESQKFQKSHQLITEQWYRQLLHIWRFVYTDARRWIVAKVQQTKTSKSTKTAPFRFVFLVVSFLFVFLMFIIYEIKCFAIAWLLHIRLSSIK